MKQQGSLLQHYNEQWVPTN